MKITKDNYFQTIENTGLESLPDDLKQEHLFVQEATQNNTNWEYYTQSEEIREVIDYQFARLENFLESTTEVKEKQRVEKPVKKKKTSTIKPIKVSATPLELSKPKRMKQKAEVKPVEKIEEEVRLIKRYLLMHGKQKSQQQILLFINAVQKAIVEKRVRKSSQYARQIEYIQENLLRVYKTMGYNIQVELKEKTLNTFREIAGSEKIRMSVAYMKRYIGIQGKSLTKEKAKVLQRLILTSIEKGVITESDPYYPTIENLLTSLKKFIASNGKILEIHEAVLNGLGESLNGLGCPGKKCGCESVEGVDQDDAVKPKNQMMNSVDFAKLEFESLGFTGKWLKLIGDPCKGFTAMVFGKPKMGKSYLCIDFAGYLARNFGKVLYVAKEEKLDATLQKKLEDKNVQHPNLFFSDYLPNDLSGFDFVFLDSVNKLGLQPEDLERLKTANKGVSFVYVFQSTKEGNFRGGNEFQHDVDVVIEIPEKGKAVQFGRFNQGGEMQIFEQPYLDMTKLAA